MSEQANDREVPVREARAAYFEANSFGPNGGYDDAWVEFTLGPLTLPIPNTQARIAAVKVHDLHHLVTGYPTIAVGEFEIAAWEIAAGCGRFVAAWVINLAGIAVGTLFWPRRLFRAFVRGRRSTSLYGRDLEPMLDGTVGQLGDATSIPVGDPEATATDVVLYALAYVTGAVVGAVAFVCLVPFLPFGFAAMAAARARSLRDHGAV